MDAPNKKESKICQICKTDANYLCFECNNYYCESCYKFVHEKQANKNHQKENIDPFIPIDLYCSIHPEEKISFYCTDDKGKLNYFYCYSHMLLILLL